MSRRLPTELETDLSRMKHTKLADVPNELTDSRQLGDQINGLKVGQQVMVYGKSTGTAREQHAYTQHMEGRVAFTSHCTITSQQFITEQSLNVLDNLNSHPDYGMLYWFDASLR